VREALGRSRGGYGTKACVITDGAGRAISFALAPGQAHELPLAQDLVDCLPDIPGWVVGDKGYASYAFRQFIWDQAGDPDQEKRSARGLPELDLQQS
jgi:Transposase DDE domain